MPTEPLLTRKSYKEQLEKQRKELREVDQPKLESQEEVSPRREDYEREQQRLVRAQASDVKTGLQKYNRFLNICLISVIVILIIVIVIQIFL